MKQKDLTLVLVMAFIGVVVALVLSRWIFATPQNREQKVEVVDVISSEFNLPPSKYFNVQAVNPTQEIRPVPGANPNPFNPQSQ